MSKVISLNQAIATMCRAIGACHDASPGLAWVIHRIPVYFLKARQSRYVRSAYPVTMALLDKWFGPVNMARAESMVFPGIDRMERLELEATFKDAMLQIESILDKVGHLDPWPSLEYSDEAKQVGVILEELYKHFEDRVLSTEFNSATAV